MRDLHFSCGAPEIEFLFSDLREHAALFLYVHALAEDSRALARSARRAPIRPVRGGLYGLLGGT